MSGTTRRPATDGVEARWSAARSTSGVSCSWPTAETTGTGQLTTARISRSSENGQQILEASAAPGENEHVDAPRAELVDRGDDRADRARALDERLRDEHLRRRETSRDRRQHVPLGRSVIPGHEPDPAREARQRPLPLGGEEALRGKRALEPLQRGEVLAEPEALDRHRAQMELASLLVEIRPAVDVDALAVDELEPQPVELAARHLDRQGRSVLRVLQREED